MLLFSYHQLKKSTISIGFMTFTSFPNGFNCKANVYLFSFSFFFFLRNLFITISFFKLLFLRKNKYPPILIKSMTGDLHYRPRLYSVFSVLEKSTTTDTILRLRNE